MLLHAVWWYDIVCCMLHCTGSCYIALVLYGKVCAFFCQPKAGGTRKNNRTLCTRTRAGFNPPLLSKANLILMPFGQRNVFIKSTDLNSGDFIFQLIYIWVRFPRTEIIFTLQKQMMPTILWKMYWFLKTQYFPFLDLDIYFWSLSWWEDITNLHCGALHSVSSNFVFCSFVSSKLQTEKQH